jgi:hypothetical protein
MASINWWGIISRTVMVPLFGCITVIGMSSLLEVTQRFKVKSNSAIEHSLISFYQYISAVQSRTKTKGLQFQTLTFRHPDLPLTISFSGEITSRCLSLHPRSKKSQRRHTGHHRLCSRTSHTHRTRRRHKRRSSRRHRRRLASAACRSRTRRGTRSRSRRLGGSSSVAVNNRRVPANSNRHFGLASQRPRSTAEGEAWRISRSSPVRPSCRCWWCRGSTRFQSRGRLAACHSRDTFPMHC